MIRWGEGPRVVPPARPRAEWDVWDRVKPASGEPASGAWRLHVSGMWAAAHSPTGLEIPVGMHIRNPSLETVKPTDDF